MGPKFIRAVRYSVVHSVIYRTTPSDGYFQKYTYTRIFENRVSKNINSFYYLVI